MAPITLPKPLYLPPRYGSAIKGTCDRLTNAPDTLKPSVMLNARPVPNLDNELTAGNAPLSAYCFSFKYVSRIASELSEFCI